MSFTIDQIKKVLAEQTNVGAERSYDAIVQLVPEFGKQLSYQQFFHLCSPRKVNVYFIECRTGCSCCSGDNHYRGLYRSKEDAEKRIKFFLESKGSNSFCPLGSQYAPRGRYIIEERSMEILLDERFVIDNTIYNKGEINFIVVAQDGSVENNDLEHMSYN